MVIELLAFISFMISGVEKISGGSQEEWGK